MRPALLSNASSTDARPTGLRSPAPLKMTSCIDSPRSADAFDSPSTQRTASMTFDLPQPLGPTMPTSWPGVPMPVGSTKDLNPESLMCVRRKGGNLKGGGEEGVSTPPLGCAPATCGTTAGGNRVKAPGQSENYSGKRRADVAFHRTQDVMPA